LGHSVYLDTDKARRQAGSQTQLKPLPKRTLFGTQCISLTHDLDLDPQVKVKIVGKANAVGRKYTDLQSPASYGHDLLTCKRSRSIVSRF